MADKHKSDAKQQNAEPELPHYDGDDANTLKDYESEVTISLGSSSPHGI